MTGPLAMSAQDLKGRRVLIRADLNAPIEDGRVRSDARLRAEIPTLNLGIARGARVILMSHLGRPEEGKFDAKLSLKPVAERLGELLGR
jgi:phosphoglycerate kinase